MKEVLATGAGAFLFAATFLVGGRVHPLRGLIRDRRGIISFGAGMSAAYVFVHLMPELHLARRAFVASMDMPLRYEGMAIYYAALVGFLVFYGLDALRSRIQESAEEGRAAPAFRLHVGGFAVYVGLMGYLLVHTLERTTVSAAVYAVPIAFHFLAVDHSLRKEHGAVYDRIGRPLLAGMSVFGWGIGLLIDLPQYVLTMLVAFISGAIIINNSVMELPREKDGRFLPFLAGGLLYGILLIPLG